MKNVEKANGALQSSNSNFNAGDQPNKEKRAASGKVKDSVKNS